MSSEISPSSAPRTPDPRTVRAELRAARRSLLEAEARDQGIELEEKGR